MEILAYNFDWMLFNLYLALIPVFAGQIMLRNKNIFSRLISGTIWFIFLPNTIYLLTDFGHFFDDLNYLSGTLLGIDLIMYFMLIVLGVFTFSLSVYPFEKMLFGYKKKINRNMPILFALNLLVGFGVVLGRVQRTNSWEIFTNTEKVIWDTLNTIRSTQLIILALVFGIICHLVYVTLSKLIIEKSGLK